MSVIIKNGWRVNIEFGFHWCDFLLSCAHISRLQFCSNKLHCDSPYWKNSRFILLFFLKKICFKDSLMEDKYMLLEAIFLLFVFESTIGALR